LTAQVTLKADGVERHVACLEAADEIEKRLAPRPCTVSRLLEVEVVDYQFGIGVDPVRGAQRQLDIVFTKMPLPDRVAHQTARHGVVGYRLVDHVPAFDAPLVAADDGLDVVDEFGLGLFPAGYGFGPFG